MTTNNVIDSGTGTTGQVMQANTGAAPTYSTATYPSTTTINQILFSSAANTITGITTANSAVMVTTSAGVPGFSGTMTSGQLIIGSTGATPTAATLTASTGISISNGGGSITLSVNGAIPVVDQNSGSVTMAVNKRYISDNGASLITYTLPAVAALGDSVEIVGASSGGWTVAQAAGQTIHFNSSNTTTGATGSLSSTNRYNCVKLVCTTANTDFTVMNSSGTLTVV